MSTLTTGQKMAGLGFNPSNIAKVDELKQHIATFLDECIEIRDNTDDPEVRRMASIAITEAQTAQMWAVKAVTWGSN